MKYLLAIALVLSLANCGAGGILTMDDRWCDQHPNAPESRCGRRPSPINVWYRAPKDEPQMANGPAVRDLDPQAIAIPDTDPE